MSRHVDRTREVGFLPLMSRLASVELFGFELGDFKDEARRQ